MNSDARKRSKTPATTEPAEPRAAVSRAGSQRFATQVNESSDVPDQFRNALEIETAVHGPLEIGFLLPPMVRPGKSGTAMIPKRAVCLLKDRLLLLSLPSDSDRVSTVIVDRSHLLGYRMTGFLLDYWITLYHAGVPQEIEIQFPVQSGELHSTFVKALFHENCHQPGGIQQSSSRSVIPLNCPAQFTRFLHEHPEVGELRDCFLQTAVPFGKARRQKCANLLVARSEDGLIALTDEETSGFSWLGLRVTYIPLRSVARAEWIDQFHQQQGAFLVFVGSAGHLVRLEWILAMRFRQPALNWIENLNSTLEYRTATTNKQSA